MLHAARPVGRLTSPWGPKGHFLLLIYHPDAIEEVLVTRNRDFVKSPGVRLLRPLVGEGLFLSEGAVWLRQRRLVQPAFHRERVASYGDVMTAFTERRLAGWKDGDVIDGGAFVRFPTGCRRRPT